MGYLPVRVVISIVVLIGLLTATKSEATPIFLNFQNQGKGGILNVAGCANANANANAFCRNVKGNGIFVNSFEITTGKSAKIFDAQAFLSFDTVGHFFKLVGNVPEFGIFNTILLDGMISGFSISRSAGPADTLQITLSGRDTGNPLLLTDLGLKGLDQGAFQFTVSGKKGDVGYVAYGSEIKDTPLPEPSSFSLVLVGMAALATYLFSARRRQNQS